MGGSDTNSMNLGSPSKAKTVKFSNLEPDLKLPELSSVEKKNISKLTDQITGLEQTNENHIFENQALKRNLEMVNGVCNTLTS